MLLVADASRPFVPSATFRGLSDSAIEARLIAEHPAAFYLYAAELLDENRMNDAMFWLCVGMIRYQFHVNAHMQRLSDEEVTFLMSLRTKLVQRLKPYNQQNFARAAHLLGRALEWDWVHENAFTSKTEHADVYPIVRKGYEKVRLLMLYYANTGTLPIEPEQPRQ